jgi:hypothetical protein
VSCVVEVMYVRYLAEADDVDFGVYRILERSQRRLEAMYGPYSRRTSPIPSCLPHTPHTPSSHPASPANRTSTTLSALQKRSEAHNRAFDEIFTMQGPPQVGGSTRSKSRTRSRTSKVKEARARTRHGAESVSGTTEEGGGGGGGEGQVLGAEVGQR